MRLQESLRQEKKTIALLVISFLVVELVIYLAAASMSGMEYRVLVETPDGRVLYETPGKSLTKYEEISLENQFGSLSNYKIRVVSKERPFPFRGWLAASVGIPVGSILVLAFVIRGYFAIFEKGGEALDLDESPKPKGIKSIFYLIKRLSIFQLGFLVVLLVISVWIIPDFIKQNMVVLWIVLAFLAFLVVWIIYLRYRLYREMLAYRFELAKMKIMEGRMIKEEPSRGFLPTDEPSNLDERKDNGHDMV